MGSIADNDYHNFCGQLPSGAGRAVPLPARQILFEAFFFLNEITCTAPLLEAVNSERLFNHFFVL